MALSETNIDDTLQPHLLSYQSSSIVGLSVATEVRKDPEMVLWGAEN